MDFTEKIFELTGQGYKVGFTRQETGSFDARMLRVVLDFEGKRAAASFDGHCPDKLTVAVLDQLKTELKAKQ